MDLSAYAISDSISIDRSPEDVYAIVADVSRMGELSPVCTGGSYDDPATGAAAGALFTGTNAIGEFGWETRCRVEVAEPGKEFSFTNLGPGDVGMELVRWGYTFEPEGSGTKVTEHWQVLPDYVPFTRGDSGMSDDDVRQRIDGMAAMAKDGIPATLGKLKELAEQS